MNTKSSPTDYAPPRLRSVSVANLEKELEAERRLLNTMPAETDPGLKIGRLTAESITVQYDTAVSAIEKMGAEVKTRIERLEAALREADSDMRLITETAAKIRERGKLVCVQIEEASNVSKEIREACAEFCKKVGVTS